MQEYQQVTGGFKGCLFSCDNGVTMAMILQVLTRSRRCLLAVDAYGLPDRVVAGFLFSSGCGGALLADLVTSGGWC